MSRRFPAVLALALAASLAACATPARRVVEAQTYSAAAADAVEPLTYPYVALHERAGRRLAFVAAAHSQERDGPTQRSVRAAFDRVRPAVVIVEGVPSSLGENPADVVALARRTDDPAAEPYARGEAGYAASLALGAGVPFVGGEPTEALQARALAAQGFDPLDVFHADLLALLGQSIRGGEITGPDDPAFDAAFGRWTVSLSIERDDPPRISYEGFADWYRAQYGVDYRSDPLFAARADPGADSLVGRIVQARSLLRDRHLLGVILRAVERYKRVLVVYGGTHRTALARALTAELGPAAVWPADAAASATAAASAGSP